MTILQINQCDRLVAYLFCRKFDRLARRQLSHRSGTGDHHVGKRGLIGARSNLTLMGAPGFKRRFNGSTVASGTDMLDTVDRSAIDPNRKPKPMNLPEYGVAA